MGKIVTYGGGEFTRREIDYLDKYSLSLTGKSNPNLLYIPTASNDEEKDIYDDYYKNFGCNIEKLFLIDSNITDKEINQKLDWADIVFAGGGDAILLMNTWKKYNLDKKVFKIYKTTDKVLCGISAGSICFYEFGHTDSLSYHQQNWDYYKLKGCGLIPAIHSPHFNEHRRQSLLKWAETESLPCIGLENCCALSVIDNKYKVITSEKNAKCHLIKNCNGKVIENLYSENDMIEI